MAAKILGRAMHHDVESDLEWFLQDGRGERVVNDRDQPVSFCERHRFPQVHQTNRRVGRSLYVQHLGPRGDQLFDSLERRSDVSHGYAHVWKQVAHQSERCAVKINSSPCFSAPSSAEEIAAIPLDVTTPASAPSNVAIFCSATLSVGFP